MNTETTQPMTPQQSRCAVALEFAEAVAALGFEVRISTEKTANGPVPSTWGMISDADGDRVCYFQAEEFNGGVSVSGCYRASKKSGTGWRIRDGVAVENVTRAAVIGWLTANAPAWANPNPVYLTRDEYLRDTSWVDWVQIEGSAPPKGTYDESQ